MNQHNCLSNGSLFLHNSQTLLLVWRPNH